WGLVDETPVTDSAITQASHELRSNEVSDFALFDPNPTTVESRSKKLARTIAFRKHLIELYDGTCSVCQTALRTPTGKVEMEGAHVVPRTLGGANDARNGLGLCRRHHWAFDRGLFGIDANRKILVPNETTDIVQNAELRDLRGKALVEAKASHL